MRETLAALIIGLIVAAVLSPESVGEWLKRVDDVRFINTMYE